VKTSELKHSREEMLVKMWDQVMTANSGPSFKFMPQPGLQRQCKHTTQTILRLRTYLHLNMYSLAKLRILPREKRPSMRAVLACRQ
jgi:hypothetical protein